MILSADIHGENMKSKIILVGLALAVSLSSIANTSNDKPKERVKYFIQTSPAVHIGPGGPNTLTIVGNKSCPVTGVKVNEIDYVIFHGKKYGFANEEAANKFLKDPDKYLMLGSDYVP